MKKKIKKTSDLKSFVKWLKVKKAYSHFGINLHRPPETLFGWIIASHDLILKLTERRMKRLNMPEGGHYSNNSKIEFKSISNDIQPHFDISGIPVGHKICTPTQEFIVTKNNEGHKELIEKINSCSEIGTPEAIELIKDLMKNGQ